MEEKLKIKVSANVNGIEEAKELLKNIEVLTEKFDIDLDVTSHSFYSQEVPE